MDKNLANLNKLDKKIYALTERTGLKLALFLIASMTTLSGSIIAPALPAIAAKFHATPHIDILAPLVMSLPALFVALTAPLAGALMDRFGRLRLLYAGMLAWSAAGVAGAWCESLYALLATRALFGIASAFVMNGANVLVADYFSIGSRREVALSAQNAVMAFMGVSMSIAVGALAGVSSEACFLVYGVGVVIWAVGLFYLFEPRRGKGNSSLGNHSRNPSAPLHCDARFSAPHSQSEAIAQSNTANTRIVYGEIQDSKTYSESSTSYSHSLSCHSERSEESTNNASRDISGYRPQYDKRLESTPHASLESNTDSEPTPAERHALSAIESHSGDKRSVSPTLKASSGASGNLASDCKGEGASLLAVAKPQTHTCTFKPLPLNKKENIESNEVNQTLEVKGGDSEAIDSESERQVEFAKAGNSEKHNLDSNKLESATDSESQKGKGGDSKKVDCRADKSARNDEQTESTPHANLEAPREVARLCGAVAMGAFACIIFYICPTQMPFILTHSLRLSPTLTGALLSLPALHYGLIALGYKRIHARLGIVRVFVLACALDGAGFALLASSQHLGDIALAFALIGAGGGLLSINASAWLFSFAPLGVRARYFGYLAGAIFLGQFLSPLISQPLVRLMGVGATLWAAAIACLCVGAVWAGVKWLGDSRRGGIL